MKKVSVVVPLYNEEAVLPHFYEKLTEAIRSLSDYEFEILFVNDGSTDQSMTFIRQWYEADQRVSFVDLSRNFGKEKAMLAGLDHCKGDCCIIMDADLQDPPALMEQMLRCWEEGYDDVYARRRDRGRESWVKRYLSLWFYRILDMSTRFEMLRNVGDFRLLDRRCIDALTRLRESERYTKGLFCWIGYRKKEILFDRDSREYGKSHWNYVSLFGLAISGLTSFTTAPLRIATVAGIITGICSIIYLLWTLVKVMIWGDPVAGFPTLISVILFLGSVQLISIGIVGEYLGRIYNESKHRPNYLIRQYEHHAAE